MSEETEYNFKRPGAQIETLLDKIPEVGNVATGRTYYLTTNGLLDNNDTEIYSLNAADIATLERMRNTSNLLLDAGFVYTGRDCNGNQSIVHLNICTDTEYIPFHADLSFVHPIYGELYKFSIDSNDDGSDYWASKVTEVSGGGRSNIKKVTQAEYDALANKEEILYIIIG